MEWSPKDAWALFRGHGLLEPLRHLRVVPLVELFELVRMLQFNVEPYTPGARRLPAAVRTLVPLHLNGHGRPPPDSNECIYPL